MLTGTAVPSGVVWIIEYVTIDHTVPQTAEAAHCRLAREALSYRCSEGGVGLLSLFV